VAYFKLLSRHFRVEGLTKNLSKVADIHVGCLLNLEAGVAQSV